MNFKKALRESTNHLRGLGYLDAQLRQNWINRNAARLRKARDVLTTEDYKTFAEDLYRLQMWNDLESENIKNGVYGENFKPTREYVKNYFNKQIADIDDTLKYHPDLDDNNAYVGDDKNTGFSPEMWGIYSSLKDDASKKEFRSKVKTSSELKLEAEKQSWHDKNTENAITLSSSGGSAGAQAIASWLIGKDPEKAKKDPNNPLYYKNNATPEAVAKVTTENTETAKAIYSKALKKYRNSSEYQKEFNSEFATLGNNKNNDATKDKNKAETALNNEFLNAVKDNPALAAASGYDPKTGEFSHEKFQQYESLLNEDSEFKARYLAHRNVLAKQLQAGYISEDDYQQSLIDIANDALKDHESFLTRAANASKAAATTGMTYSLHKFAPIVNIAEIYSKRKDGKVFTDTNNNIYKDSDIMTNAEFTDPNNIEEAVIYKTSDGTSINYNKDKDKIFVKNGISYIYQNRDGSFIAVDPNTVNLDSKHVKRVNAVRVRNANIDPLDLIRLGKDDSGNDLNWANGVFNERYLQLADRYNVMPWDKEELDYYNQFGYSKYINIQRPGDDSRDFWGETIKMMGFVGADLLSTFITRGAGKALRFSGPAMRGVELGTGLMGAAGIADSYAQGVFEENVSRNIETLKNIVSDKAKEKAEDWANNEGQELINQEYAKALKAQEEKFGRALSETEKAHTQMAVRAYIVGNKAMQLYAEDMQSPDIVKKQESAIDAAGTSALIDLFGEGLKYGIVNTLGFRSWMFKSRNAAEAAARASEKTLFGKAFSRVAKATQKEVDLGLAKNVGDVYLKDAWSTMSKAQKARAVLETTGKQFWGGAWTNWTDEMQSAGAKAQNNSVFDMHLDNNTPTGTVLFANALTSHLRGAIESAFEVNSLWAGLIGGAGSVLGFGFNPMGIVEAATDRASWNNKSKGEKFNSIFSNSVLSEVYQLRANDHQAQQMLDRANELIKSVDGNTESIINALYSASKIGHSENPVEAEEANVTNLFHTLLALDNFSKTNPGLVELDALSNIRNFAENAEKLTDVSKLSDEEKQEYIEQIKVANPNMTEAEATQELENVSKRANLMQKMISDWTDLQKSEDYKKAASKTEEKSEEQENMEQRLELQALQDYTLQNMREREQKIKGSSSIDIIDNISTPIAEYTYDGKTATYRARENEELATFGNKKSALKNIKESYKILAFKLEQRKSNMEKAQANLKFDEKAEALKEQINRAITPTEKEVLQKQLIDLTRDNAYYTLEIARIKNELKENADQQARLEAHFANATPDSEIVFTARNILNLDPIARMRMLDSNNFDNYNKKQQTQIKKAIAELSKNGLDFSDIQNQALAFSRYAQRGAMLENLANDETVSPSFRTTVTNMIDAANQMVLSNVIKYSKTKMKEIKDTSSTNEEAIVAKLNFLKGYSSYALHYIKENLNRTDQKLVEEVIPLVEAGEQLVDLIYNENYGLTGLNMDERRNLQKIVADTMTQSRTTEELIDHLAQTAANTLNPSINTLLDKLGQVYEQQHSTIVETAKERAERLAKDRREAQARKQTVENIITAVETASDTPSKTPVSETQTAEETTVKPTYTISTTDGKTDTELIQDAKNTILTTQTQVQPVTERDPHADHYLINGEKYMRVHGAIGDVWVGSNSPNKEANSARSLKNGSIVDSIVRDFFNEITPAKPAHFSDEAFASLMTSLETIKAKLIENGEEFLTNNIVLYHKFPNGVKIAGEADIVSIKIVDGKPQYNIYDLKTSAGDKDTGNAFNQSRYWETNPTAGARNTVIGTREQYTNQVSLYKLLFERMFNTPVTNLALLPYKLTYNAENNVTGIEKYPGIALTYNPNVEKLIAYQPAIDDAISKIQHTYKGMFTKEQLATLKGVIANGIIKGEAFGKDIAYFINNQGLESQFKEVGMGELSPIIRDLKETVSSIDVTETLKEEFKAPEPLPTPATPAELATVEPTGIEYSPTKESFTEPDVDAEFNTLGEDADTTHLIQNDTIIDEDEQFEASNKQTVQSANSEVSATIKGNALSPYIYEDTTKGIEDADRQDAKRGILIPKTPEPGGSLEKYQKWMKARKIDLQGLIDDKLSDILSTGTDSNPVKIRFMRVNPNMTATGGYLMEGHYLLVVEDSPAIRKVYNQNDIDRYGDFINANGSKWLIIGTAGFANPSQGNAYRSILTKGSNSVLTKSNNYFKANANEEFYVDQDKYTHVAKIHSGFITKQLATDSIPQVRRLSELLNDSERNPLGLTLDSLVFGYQMKNEFRTVPDVDPSMYHAPAKAMHNIGNVFLYIKGADGRYTPTMLIPTRYSEISQGTLKNKIDNAIRMLTSLDHAQRYKGLLELYNLVVIGQKDNNGIVTGTNILIGTDKIPSLKFILNGKPLYETDLNNVNFQEVLEGFSRLNPRISVTKNKLLSEERLRELDEAGALRTDIAKLGKSAGDYSVYNIGSDGKPIIVEKPIVPSNHEITRGAARKIRVNGQYFSKIGDKYIDEGGNEVTDNALIESIKLNEFILNNEIDASITIGTTEYFIPNINDTQSIIAREVGTHRAHIVTDTAQIDSVKQFIQKERAEAAQASRDAAASAELEGVAPIVETAPITSAEQTPQAPADLRNSVMDLLDMDGKGTSVKATPETVQEHIQIVNTHQGMQNIFSINEWNKKVGDARSIAKDHKTGWYKHNGITFYAQFGTQGRGGDNISIWFKEAPSTKVKQQFELWLKNAERLNEFDTLSRILNGETVYSTNIIPESASSSQNINITERKSLIEANNSAENGTFARERNAMEILQDEAFQDIVLDECESLWPETADMTFGEIIELLKNKGKVTTGIKDVQTWIDTLKC